LKENSDGSIVRPATVWSTVGVFRPWHGPALLPWRDNAFPSGSCRCCRLPISAVTSQP